MASENPEAVVVLSVRDSAETWWQSADRTIFENLRSGDRDSVGLEMIRAVVRGHIASYEDAAVVKAAYELHNAEVIHRTPPERLVVWQPEDGWGPICAALDVPVPSEPFPRTNTSEEFRARFGWD